MINNQTPVDNDAGMPCGNCDIGVYSELALLNPRARAFGALPSEERVANLPKCKTRDCACVGATDFHKLLNQVDEIFTRDSNND